MIKIKASIAVIGFQKEDHKMYPHLHDFLMNLRSVYDEVIYIDDDDRGIGLYSFDRLRQLFLSRRGLNALIYKLRSSLSIGISGAIRSRREKRTFDSHGALSSTGSPTSFRAVGRDIAAMVLNFLSFAQKRNRLIKKLKTISFVHKNNCIIAIDHTAAYYAGKYYCGKIIFWSFDIPAEDYPEGLRREVINGYYERLIISKYATKADTVIIQDEDRRQLLQKAVGKIFDNVIYLPVSLNDSAFSKAAAEKRRKNRFDTRVTVIQSGGIGKNRFSDKLIDSLQRWAACHELLLHGFISPAIFEQLQHVRRKPQMSTTFYDHTNFQTFLDKSDIGFVGYAEKDENHLCIENASSQLVAFLRLGIPIIACGPDLLIDFVNKNAIGLGIISLDDMEQAIGKITDQYERYSINARAMYEKRFNLSDIFSRQVMPAIDQFMKDR